MKSSMSDRDVIRKHYAKIGRKGGRSGKGSQRRLWAGRLAAATRWGNADLAAVAKAKLESLSR